jgi:ferredoxin
MTQRKISVAGRKVEILPGCIVCKTCEFTAPEIFMVPEKGLSAEVLVAEPEEEQLESVLEAIRSCPESVIKFRKKREEP